MLLNEQMNERLSLHPKYETEWRPVTTPQPAGAQKSSSEAHLLFPPFLLSPSHIYHTEGSPEACRVEVIGHCSTYQDALTPLPGVCGVIVFVQGKAHVAWILQLPIGELDCKITVQEWNEIRRTHNVWWGGNGLSVGRSDWKNENGKEAQVLTSSGTEDGPGAVGKRGWGGEGSAREGLRQ